MQRNCLGQVGRGRRPSGDGEQKAYRQGLLHSSRGAVVNGAHRGSGVHSLHTHTCQSRLKEPFSFHPCCKTKSLKWPRPSEGGKHHSAQRLTWPNQSHLLYWLPKD